MSNAPVRIFIVEDDRLIASLEAEMLQELGFEIAGLATTIPDALRQINLCEFDLALLDVNVNGMKCFVVAEALQQRGLPFAFASGYGWQALREDMRDRPIVTKPFTIRELEQVLADAISNLPRTPPTQASHRVGHA